MKIRKYVPEDMAEWVRMRLALWPEIAEGEASPDADAMDWLSRQDAVVLVAERPDSGGLMGFAEVGERTFADGCDTAPVAYLEGWYVDVAFRGQGMGRALIAAAEDWARRWGYREFASDALLETEASQKAHEGVGFSEVERAVRYRKVL